MSWIVRIEGEKYKYVKIDFNPTSETITINGECRLKNYGNEYHVISSETRKMDVSLDGLMDCIGVVIHDMNKRLKTYESLNESFKIIKIVGTNNTDIKPVIKDENIIYGNLDEPIE